ncbi:hypothetical protein [Leptolyngbya sp. NIES-2104]|uniref:hypothetical protein n=1 Tax=Leptolyngbya sp. NIES-2104 TaxID=1552121 RepID=UPI0006EC8CA4|nr:hypothetical protein [Leptolyngbya sp. NIES-2104]GAP93648.1 hypothetical protein NIES2104_01550 [Leptolyngbya sp. NIES-2104]
MLGIKVAMLGGSALIVTVLQMISVIFRELAHGSGRISYKKSGILLVRLMLEVTGAAIAKIAFDEFVKSGAGEVAKKAVGGAIEQLRSTIKHRFKGNQKAESAIEKIEKEQSPEALNKLSVYLDDEMEDIAFAQTLQQIAEQITNVQNNSERQYNNYGRDQINIGNITGDPKIGG